MEIKEIRGGGKGRPCWRFSMGTCQAGQMCSFEHRELTADEIKQRDNASAMRQQQQYKGAQQQSFGGGKGGYQPKSSSAAGNNPFFSSPKVCPAYLSGSCKFGVNCRDVHVWQQPQYEATQGMVAHQAIQGGAPFVPTYTVANPKPPPTIPQQSNINNPFAMGQGYNVSNPQNQ